MDVKKTVPAASGRARLSRPAVGRSRAARLRTGDLVVPLVAALLIALALSGQAVASDDGNPPLVIPVQVELPVPQVDWWAYDGEGVDAVNRALRAKAVELIDRLVEVGHVFGEYTVRLERDGLISVSMLYSAYREPMAHPAHWMGAVTADVTTGAVYALADLFVDDRYIDVLSQAVARGIVEQDIPTLIDFERIAPDQDFYLTPEGLVVFFQTYELAPYAWGFPQFTVPYAELASIAKPDGPIARLAAAGR